MMYGIVVETEIVSVHPLITVERGLATDSASHPTVTILWSGRQAASAALGA